MSDGMSRREFMTQTLGVFMPFHEVGANMPYDMSFDLQS